MSIKTYHRKTTRIIQTASEKDRVFPPRIRGGGTVLPAFLSINLSLLFAICSIIMVDKKAEIRDKDHHEGR